MVENTPQQWKTLVQDQSTTLQCCAEFNGSSAMHSCNGLPRIHPRSGRIAPMLRWRRSSDGQPTSYPDELQLASPAEQEIEENGIKANHELKHALEEQHDFIQNGVDSGDIEKADWRDKLRAKIKETKHKINKLLDTLVGEDTETIQKLPPNEQERAANIATQNYDRHADASNRLLQWIKQAYDAVVKYLKAKWEQIKKKYSELRDYLASFAEGIDHDEPKHQPL